LLSLALFSPYFAEFHTSGHRFTDIDFLLSEKGTSLHDPVPERGRLREQSSDWRVVSAEQPRNAGACTKKFGRNSTKVQCIAVRQKVTAGNKLEISQIVVHGTRGEFAELEINPVWK